MPIETVLWIVLGVTIATVLTLDLLVFNRDAHAPSFREAALLSAFYIGLGPALRRPRLRLPQRRTMARPTSPATCWS